MRPAAARGRHDGLGVGRPTAPSASRRSSACRPRARGCASARVRRHRRRERDRVDAVVGQHLVEVGREARAREQRRDARAARLRRRRSTTRARRPAAPRGCARCSVPSSRGRRRRRAVGVRSSWVARSLDRVPLIESPRDGWTGRATLDRQPGRRGARPRRAPREVLGVPLALTDYDGTLDWIDATVARRRRGYVCVAAVHTVMASQDDPELRAAVLGADFTVPDGQPLVWALNAARPPARRPRLRPGADGPRVRPRRAHRAAHVPLRRPQPGRARAARAQPAPAPSRACRSSAATRRRSAR